MHAEIQLIIVMYYLPYLCSESKIGSEGVRNLAQPLKQNTTLTQLNLEGTSELSGFMFVCAW